MIIENLDILKKTPPYFLASSWSKSPFQTWWW